MTYVPTPQTPYFQAVLEVNGNIVPAKPGASLMCPANYVYEPLIGNAYQWTEGEGLQSPVVDVELEVRDAVDADGVYEALGAGIMGLLFGRSDDIAFDTSSTAVVYWDGRTGFTMPVAKLESMTLSVTKGDDIRVSVRIVAASNPGAENSAAIQAVTEAPSLINWSNAPQLRFSHITFADQTGATGGGGTPASVGYLANRVWTFNMSYANNHTPNLALDGTVYPDAMNAGTPTGGASITMQAADGLPLDGVPIVATIAGNNLTRVFTLQNPRNQTPSNRQIGAPRVMRTHQLILRGAAGREQSGWAGGATASSPVIFG